MNGISTSAGRAGRINPRVFLKGLALILTFAVLGYILEASSLDHVLNKAWVDSEVRGKGLTGELLFIGVGALFSGVGMPRQLICFLGGYAFGFWQGTLLSLLASLLGCAGAFGYARLLGREFVAKRFAGRIGKMDDFLRRNPLTMTLIIRFLPVGSNLVTNLVAGVSSVGAVPFLLGSTLGYTPQTVIFTLLGGGFSVNPSINIAVSIALFVISSAAGVAVYRKVSRGRSLGEKLDAVLDDELDGE